MYCRVCAETGSLPLSSLLLGADGEAGAEPGLGQAVMLARIAGKIPVAVVEAVDILLEALHPKPLRETLGVPDHRVGEPAARGGGLAPGGQPVIVAGFEGQSGQIFIHQEAAVITHQRQRYLEGGGGWQLAGAIPLAADGLACAIGKQHAAGGRAGGQ